MIIISLTITMAVLLYYLSELDYIFKFRSRVYCLSKRPFKFSAVLIDETD